MSFIRELEAAATSAKAAYDKSPGYYSLRIVVTDDNIQIVLYSREDDHSIDVETSNVSHAIEAFTRKLDFLKKRVAEETADLRSKIKTEEETLRKLRNMTPAPLVELAQIAEGSTDESTINA